MKTWYIIIRWVKHLNIYSELDRDRTIHNIDLFRAILLHYNVLKFHVPKSNMFGVIADKYCTVSFCKYNNQY